MEPLDLVGPLSPGEVRAGVITDQRALFAGVSAEGSLGDIKIYNDRVQYVIQTGSDGDHYIQVGGQVIDADIVRPPGVLGRDAVDEWGPMFGLGRLAEAESVIVIDDGRNGGAATVRVQGSELPMALLEGSLEVPGFVPWLGLEITTDYVLQPDTYLLEVRSTVRATSTDVTLDVGDVLLPAPEVTDSWGEGGGLQGAVEPWRWTGFVSKRNDLAMAILAPAAGTHSAGQAELLTELTELAASFTEDVVIGANESVTMTRFYGVGPSMASLSDAWLALDSAQTSTVEGTVVAADGPVAGARVHVLVDEVPFTMAVTDLEGSFRAATPAGAEVRTVATGRGDGLYTDLPPGYGSMSPYGVSMVSEQVLESFRSGADPLPLAQGRGVGADGDALTLSVPATLAVSAADGLPFAVRLEFVDGDQALADDRLTVGRPRGYAAAAWSRDGAVELPVQAGRYRLVAHRGMRFEVYTADLDLLSGERTEIEVVLPAAFDHAGWLLADPHAHASPSGDGGITMEDRLVVHAATGYQLHFGTDHDHVPDYGPTLRALGLDAVMATVVADEVSPPLRGHFNIYPLTPNLAEANHGAFLWWHDVPDTTADMLDSLTERHGPEVVVQVNHPTSSGLASSASWSEGTIGSPDRWSADFQAVEVLNDGETDSFLSFWWDVFLRGTLATPVGVTDSHDHFGGDPGINGTFLYLGDDASPGSFTDAALVDAMAARATIASRGVFLHMSVTPGSTVGPGTEVEVEARSASWAVVDVVELLMDGEVVDSVEGSAAVFTLDPDRDAAFAIVARGDTAMQPVEWETPWALSSPILVDVGGDGWSPPLPPLEQ